MSTVLRVIIFVATLCMLAGCATRIGPGDSGPTDAAAEQTFHCVEPEPLPQVASCNDLGEENLCRLWARQYADGAVPYTWCLRPAFAPNHDAACVQAFCTVVDGGYDCHCGNEPACGPGQVCVGDTLDATPYCRCTMR